MTQDNTLSLARQLMGEYIRQYREAVNQMVAGGHTAAGMHRLSAEQKRSWWASLSPDDQAQRFAGLTPEEQAEFDREIGPEYRPQMPQGGANYGPY